MKKIAVMLAVPVAVFTGIWLFHGGNVRPQEVEVVQEGREKLALISFSSCTVKASLSEKNYRARRCWPIGAL